MKLWALLVSGALLLVGLHATDASAQACDSGAVEGVACAPSTDSVSNADVSITYLDCMGSPQTDTVQTDVQGQFTLSNIPIGTWSVNLEKGPYSRASSATVLNGQTTQLTTGQTCFDPSNTSIAVVTGDYDKVEDVLTSLGLLYDLYDGTLQNPDGFNFLLNSNLEDYDAIFINCGFHPEADFTSQLPDVSQIGQKLRSYAAGGGYVYASDWAYYVVESGFSEQIDFLGEDLDPQDVLSGAGGVQTLNITDTELAGYLSETTILANLDLQGWAVPLSTSSKPRVFLEGDASLQGGGTVSDAPFMVSFPHGDGSIIYTSYHIHANEAVGDIFQFMVLSFKSIDEPPNLPALSSWGLGALSAIVALAGFAFMKRGIAGRKLT